MHFIRLPTKYRCIQLINWKSWTYWGGNVPCSCSHLTATSGRRLAVMKLYYVAVQETVYLKGAKKTTIDDVLFLFAFLCSAHLTLKLRDWKCDDANAISVVSLIFMNLQLSHKSSVWMTRGTCFSLGRGDDLVIGFLGYDFDGGDEMKEVEECIVLMFWRMKKKKIRCHHII